MLDADESMSLEHAEIVTAVQKDQKVINFLRDCGNRFLQELLEPTRLSTALAKLDTNQDGSIGIGRCPSLRRRLRGYVASARASGAYIASS